MPHGDGSPQEKPTKLCPWQLGWDEDGEDGPSPPCWRCLFAPRFLQVCPFLWIMHLCFDLACFILMLIGFLCHMLNLKAVGLLGPDLTSKWNKSATKFNMDFATWSQRLDPTKYLLPSKTLKSCHHQRLNHTCTQQDTWQTTTWCTTLTQCNTPQDTIGNNTFQHNAIKRQILDVLLQLPCHICCIENLYIHHFFGQVKLLRFLNLVVL